MFTLEKSSNTGNVIKQIFKVEPEAGQCDGSGSSQIPPLWAAPALKPWGIDLLDNLHRDSTKL